MRLSLTVKLFSLATILSTTVVGCGPSQQPKNLTHYPTVTVSVRSTTSLSSMPVVAALKMGFFGQEHIHVVLSPGQKANIEIRAAGKKWPIQGVIMQRPDAFLVAPTPDPHFRLRSLNNLPLFYAKSQAGNLPFIEAVLDLHAIQFASLHPLSTDDAVRLIAHRELPWAIMSLKHWQHVRQKNPMASILSWYGASTGPIPVDVVTSSSPYTPRFLAAINMALWYLHTTSPRKINTALYGNHSRTETQIIAQAQQYGFWPQSVYPYQKLYERGRHLMSLSHTSSLFWPQYSQGVQSEAANQAFSLLK